MPARFRSRAREVTTPGDVQLSGIGTWLTSSSVTSDFETCDDTTMPRPYTTDHNLVLTRRFTNPLVLGGSTPVYIGGNRTMTFNGYKPSNRASYTNTPNVSVVSNSFYKTKALANLDPLRPDVDVPLFAFELRELPRAIRDLGRVLSGRMRSSDVAGGYLAYHFGWAPLISDLNKLFDFTKATWDRCRYLRKLEAGTRVRRHLKRGEVLYSNTVKDGYNAVSTGMPANGGWAIRADVKTEERLWVWFTANAKLTMPLPTDNRELYSLSGQIVRGMTFRPASVWEYIPWTWLIDYCLSVGDYLQALDGMTRFETTRMCLMKMQIVDSTLENVRLASGLNATTSLLRTVQKTRTAYAYPTPSISSDRFLTDHQQTILASLATASALRGVRGLRTPS